MSIHRRRSSARGPRVSKDDLLKLALTDSLTGLPNRRAVDEFLERVCVAASAHSSHMSVAFADIDFFKSFNDRFGHLAGDDCLRMVATALMQEIRDGDFVGRYGGEEFIIVFPDTDGHAALEIAERLRRAVAQLDVRTKDAGSVAVSISIGLAEYHPGSLDTPQLLMAAADAALYAAKRSGRNRTCLDDDEGTHLHRNARLPAERSSLIGRDRDCEQVAELLHKHRLVTLTGPGGIGKTRLALSVAKTMRPSFRDDVWWIELSELFDPHLVAVALAEALGIAARDADQALHAAVLWLQARDALLVFDNCEHLRAPIAALADAILERCPSIRILATGREALKTHGEAIFSVPSLPFGADDSDTELDLAATRELAAVRLFEERARLVLPEFDINAGNFQTVASICRRVDGIPTAIELAAARLRALAPNDLLAELTERFALLNEGLQTQHSRHSTLRALFSWSYRLLTEQEQQLFRRLAVFSGGWTLEAAREVCANESLERSRIPETLGHLVDKSLVLSVTRPDGPQRFRFLEATREYALDLLHDSVDATTTPSRHIAYVARRAATMAGTWPTTPTRLWLPEILDDLDNARTALRRALDDELAPSVGAALCLDLVPVWLELGLTHEGAAWIARAMALQAIPAAAIPRGNACLAWMLLYAGHPHDAIAPAEQAILASRDSGDTHTYARAACVLAIALRECAQDLERSRMLFAEALQLFEASGDRLGVVDALNGLAMQAYFDTQFDEAKELAERSLRIARRLGRRFAILRQLTNLAGIAFRREEFDRAAVYLHEATVLGSGTRRNRWYAIAFANLADLELTRGNLDTASDLFARGLRLLAMLTNDLVFAYATTNAGRLASALGKHETAAQLLGFADATFERLQSTRDAMNASTYNNLVATLVSALGSEGFDTAYSTGTALSLSETLRCVEALS